MPNSIVPTFSTRLWSEEVGRMAHSEVPEIGYVFSNGRGFVQTPYDPRVPDPVVPESDLARAHYDELPEAIKLLYTYEQYLWLSDADKAHLIETETEPDRYGY